MAPALLFWWLSNALAIATSPWAASEWRINLNIGREAGTYVSDEWGASGARLMLPVEVLVESERYTYDNDSSEQTEKDFMGGSGACDVMSVLEDAVYITGAGEQTVRFGSTGAWKISTRRTGMPGDACVVRFWLDVIDAAVRNDVSLEAGERLYCTANCWRDTEFAAGRRRIAPMQARVQDAQNKIDARLEHATGDRRLDGSDILDTALASIDMAVLVKRRDDLLLELRDAERKLPPAKDVSKAGHWPGTTEKLVIAKGKIGVKRKKGLWDEFHILGTWTATPLEGVSEIVYYEEEEALEKE